MAARFWPGGKIGPELDKLPRLAAGQRTGLGVKIIGRGPEFPILGIVGDTRFFPRVKLLIGRQLHRHAILIETRALISPKSKTPIIIGVVVITRTHGDIDLGRILLATAPDQIAETRLRTQIDGIGEIGGLWGKTNAVNFQLSDFPNAARVFGCFKEQLTDVNLRQFQFQD